MWIEPDERRRRDKRLPILGGPEITGADVLWSVGFWGLVAGLVWVMGRWV